MRNDHQEKIMSELTLQLPDTLVQRLETLAQTEGVSLDRYIVYTLTRQASLADTIQISSSEEIAQQKANYFDRLQKAGKVSEAKMDEILASREVVEPEPDLRLEVIEKVRKLIANRQGA
jgi:hypothetical protein